jgi:hypothetical protein
MSEMQCAGVRRDLQSAMWAMSEMQYVPSSRKTYPCQKFVQWEQNCCMRMDRHTNGQTDVTKLLVAFRNFASAPNNRQRFAH